jgi:hypothetical protein
LEILEKIDHILQVDYIKRLPPYNK